MPMPGDIRYIRHDLARVSGWRRANRPNCHGDMPGTAGGRGGYAPSRRSQPRAARRSRNTPTLSGPESARVWNWRATPNVTGCVAITASFLLADRGRVPIDERDDLAKLGHGRRRAGGREVAECAQPGAKIGIAEPLAHGGDALGLADGLLGDDQEHPGVRIDAIAHRHAALAPCVTRRRPGGRPERQWCKSSRGRFRRSSGPSVVNERRSSSSRSVTRACTSS